MMEKPNVPPHKEREEEEKKNNTDDEKHVTYRNWENTHRGTASVVVFGGFSFSEKVEKEEEGQEEEGDEHTDIETCRNGEKESERGKICTIKQTLGFEKNRNQSCTMRSKLYQHHHHDSREPSHRTESRAERGGHCDIVSIRGLQVQLLQGLNAIARVRKVGSQRRRRECAKLLVIKGS